MPHWDIPHWDFWLARIIAPLACWILLNGLDDLVVDVAALIAHFRESVPSEDEIDAVPPRRMAIFVACWKEYKVIRKMLDRNATGLNYRLVEFFVGVYPNDTQTVAAVREALKKHPHVHMTFCPHEGPTSKADCLNWIYQGMLLYEKEHGVRFDMALTHDAEDSIDPDGLRWINYYARDHDFVQIPVLAVPTPLREWAHGVYCDEFTESQYRDMPARQLMGGFIPSNGVGTGYSRKALEMLAAAHNNRVFEPCCLTEDYENGWRVSNMGLKQKFVPIHFRHGRAIATREYFPRRAKAAIRQRTRWVTGITLQSWELHSARDTLKHLYWFWRDRRGLIGNLATPLGNVAFLIGLNTWAAAKLAHHPWGLAEDLARFYWISIGGLTLQAMHTALRMTLTQRVYGWKFAAGVPLRVLVANALNACSTAGALWNYTAAKIRGEPLRWAKTEHAFPGREALMQDRKRVGEILTGGSWITPEALESALLSQPRGKRIGEHLVASGLISEHDFYTALALQNQLPLGVPDDEAVSPVVARSFPAAIVRKWRVLPFRIAAGALHVAGSELPVEEMQTEMRRFSSLDIRFYLITPTQFDNLAQQYLFRSEKTAAALRL